MAVKPNKKLINNKIQKYSPREIQRNSQRKNIQNKIKIKEIFFLQKSLQPSTKGLDDFILFLIIKLIYQPASRDAHQGTKDNSMNFNICKINGFNYKKSKNIERKSKKNQPKNPHSQKQTDKLHRPMKKKVFHSETV